MDLCSHELLRGTTMDHAATLRGCYALINAGDVDGFGDSLADDFVEHEETPGLEPTNCGVKALFPEGGGGTLPVAPSPHCTGAAHGRSL